VKKIFQAIGLFTLICFSFFYTDKAIVVLKEQDPLMIEIENNEKKYYLSPIDAKLENDEILPGKNGCKININKSYKKMKTNGVFNENLIVYDKIEPKIKLEDYYNSYITKGNSTNKVALILIGEEEKYLNDLEKIIKNKNIKINLFLNTSYLNNNIKKLYNLNKIANIYNYGNEGIYKKDLIVLGNNIINRNTTNLSKYCLQKEKNEENLKICSENKMHTILPSIIIETSLYQKISSNINPGDIILINLNQKNLNELKTTIDFILKKGISLVTLNELLSEDI